MSPLPDRDDRREEHLSKGLTEKQLIAVEMACMGKGIGDIAEALGVSRQSLWRWFKSEPVRAAKRRLSLQLHQQRTERFWRLQSLALDVAEESLREGDPRMATDILKMGAAGFRDIVEVEELELGEPPGEWSTDDSRGSKTVEEMPKADRGDEARTCDVCGKVSKSPRGLDQHTRRSHP